MMPSLWIAQSWPIHLSESEDMDKLLVYCLANLPKDRDIAMRKLMVYCYLTIKWRGFHMLQALNAKRHMQHEHTAINWLGYINDHRGSV